MVPDEFIDLIEETSLQDGQGSFFKSFFVVYFAFKCQSMYETFFFRKWCKAELKNSRLWYSLIRIMSGFHHVTFAIMSWI